MAIRERTPGVWQVRVYRGTDPTTGARRWESATVHGGERRARARERQMLGAPPADRSSPLPSGTVGQVITEVIDHLEAIGRAPSTIRGYRSHAARILTDPIAAMPWSEMRARDVDAYYRRLLAGAMTPATVGKYHSLLRTAAGGALRWEWADRNVVRDASPPARHAQRVTSPDTAVVRRILAELDQQRDPTHGLAARLHAILGCRRGELCGLRWSDIDLEARTVAIRRSRDATPGAPAVKDTKTHQECVVAIDETTTAWLRRWHTNSRARALAVGLHMAADGYVLSTVADSARPIHPDTLTGAWRRAAVKAGHPEVRLLDLRHWSASVLIDAGEDPVVVASRLGHADPSTTRRFYAASMDASEQRAAATVGQLLAELN